MRLWSFCATLAFVSASFLAAPTAAAADVTSEEFALYMDWRDGREDPRLAEFSDAVKLKKIARNLKVKPKVLKAAIEKVEPVASSIGKDTETGIRDHLAKTPLKGRVKEVHVDARQGHVVAGIKWSCGDPRDVDKEAAYAGWAVGQAGSVVKTVVVWCVNSIDTKLFSAKIARSAAARISEPRIERFASSRYIKLFEEVRRGPHK